MADKQPNSNCDNNSNTSTSQVPSWDEFNFAHDEEHQETTSASCGPEEFGPSLPPGFGVDESQLSDSHPEGIHNGSAADFTISTENCKFDAPEDPSQGNSSDSSKKIVGPQIPSSFLPRIVQQKSEDQFSLPSLGHSQSQSDFVPVDQPQPCSSSGCEEKIIGPTLPVPNAPIQKAAAVDFDIGPAMPPDEPKGLSCGIEEPVAGSHSHHRAVQERKQQIMGPTLPTSSDEEEEEEGNEESKCRRMNGKEEENRGGEGGEEEEEEDSEDGKEEEQLVGPMPPGQSEEEEQAEYFRRLARLEASKQSTSNELRREEWMTELPQKMLKTGVFGPVKTSFSRTNAPATLQSDLWTKMPGGDANKQANVVNTSTSTGKSAKRTKMTDEREERVANELNKDRNESLLDIHQKKHKLDQQGSSSGSLITTEAGERRPFNRDTDIDARGFRGPSGGASELKERMGNLQNRFGHGIERKFL